MKRLKVSEAAAEWGVPEYTVRWLCETNQLPPGYAAKVMKGHKRNTFYIWRLDNAVSENKCEMS